MQQVIRICNKELKDYFISPIAYIVISIFLLVTGWFFFTTFFYYNQADLRNFFGLLPITFAFLIPAVTMRLFSEEMNVGSYELLLTLPVTFKDILLGKFLAGVIIRRRGAGAHLCLSNLHRLYGPVGLGTCGRRLSGRSFTGCGLCLGGAFSSSLTRNQIIAFIVGMAICFSLTLIDKMLFFFPGSLLGVIGYLGADFHFQNIAKGIIDSRDILYFLSVVFIGLYGTHLVMQEKN